MGAFTAGEGSTDNYSRPSRRHSSQEVVNIGAKLFQGFRVYREAGGDRSRRGPRARQAGQGAQGGEGCRPPHSRWPLAVRLRSRSAPRPCTAGTLPHLSPRTTLGASENVTSGIRPAPPRPLPLVCELSLKNLGPERRLVGGLELPPAGENTNEERRGHFGKEINQQRRENEQRTQ